VECPLTLPRKRPQAVGDKTELKSGAAVAVAAATKKPDGTFTAARINVGRGEVKP
jgi:hypothetical protein